MLLLNNETGYEVKQSVYNFLHRSVLQYLISDEKR